jgi:hypothetical protein
MLMTESVQSFEDFRESMLVSVRANSRPSQVRLQFSMRTGRTLFIEASGVLAFRMGNLGLRNLVARVSMPSGPSTHAMTIANNMKWMSAIEPATQRLSDPLIQLATQRVLQGDLRMLLVEPLLGAQACLLCEHVRIAHEQTFDRP